MSGFVYKWTNIFNNKWYIGSHFGVPSDNYIGSGLCFKAALEKYGLSAFTREILYIGENFRTEESKILNFLNASGDPMSYNVKNDAIGGPFPGSLNGMFNKHHSNSSKEKISISLKANRWSEEAKIRHSELMKGENNPLFGVGHSEYSKNKMRETKKRLKEDWGFLRAPKVHLTIFKKIFNDIKKHGTLVSPRGELILELENYSYTLDPYVRFANFKHRKLNLDYIKKEFLWYLIGDKFDTSISEHASIWKKCVNLDGSINSNYGQYIFGDQKQFDVALRFLIEDKDSRRASIIILTKDHLLQTTEDFPCTYSINFRIRNDKLNMSVHMRSQDAIFGMGNDIPCFSFIHEMMLFSLKQLYPNLELGKYHHTVDSFHVYKRHFEMLDKILSDSKYSMVYCPKISSYEEVDFLRKLDYSNIPVGFKFSKWLLNKESEV